MGGFLFISLSHLFRYGAERLEGYKLIFQAAVAGTCLSAIARLIVLAVFSSTLGRPIVTLWSAFSPFPFSATDALAFLLGPLLAFAMNFFYDREEALSIEIRRRGSALLQLFHDAASRDQLVSITLDNRKCYVGWIARSSKLRPQDEYFCLLPYMSGYRDSNTLKTSITVLYEGVLESRNFRSDDLVIILPLAGVKTAGLFDVDIYDEYFSEDEGDI